MLIGTWLLYLYEKYSETFYVEKHIAQLLHASAGRNRAEEGVGRVLRGNAGPKPYLIL